MKRQRKYISIVLTMALYVHILFLSGMFLTASHVYAEEVFVSTEEQSTPPHLLEVLKTYPELLEFLMKTSPEEYRHEPSLIEISLGIRSQQAYTNDNLEAVNIQNNGYGEVTLYHATKVESQFVEAAGGELHSVAVKSDGTVWTWGVNWYGQLGDGTTTNRSTPMQVSDLGGVTGIAGGDYHTVALKEDGTVWTWGDNRYGQLGDGIAIDMRTTPVQVGGLNGVTAIAASRGYYSMALKDDGTVYAWGQNYWGQLGNGESAVIVYPVLVCGTPVLQHALQYEYNDNG